MAYFHGVKTSEVATSVTAPVQTTAGLPVVYGTAPIHLASNPAPVNRPVLCYSYQEAVSQFGYSKDWKSFTLCEAMKAEFQLYNVAPIVFVNVLDPAKHKKAVTDTKGQNVSANKTVTLTEPVILASLKVKAAADAAKPAILNTDYTAAYDEDGHTIVSLIAGGALGNAAKIWCDYDAVDTTAVTADDIIGGVDADDNPTGLETINQVYTLFGMIPGMIAAPGWSQNPEVAAVMKAKASNINNLFECLVLCDVDTTQVSKYTDVNTWKNNNSYTGRGQIVCWPKIRMGDDVYYASTHVMGLIGQMDAANDDVPYQSPSNLALQATGICLDDGTEVILNLDQANLLNSQGVYTALNFVGGWRGWGNYTGAYPASTDVKDTFIAVRRMFNWQAQTFILSNWQHVDRPMLPRLVKTLVDNEQIRLNGLVARGFMLGADIKFLESENPTTDLLNGIIRIHAYLGFALPAQHIEEVLEYDVDYLDTLFAS